MRKGLLLNRRLHSLFEDVFLFQLWLSLVGHDGLKLSGHFGLGWLLGKRCLLGLLNSSGLFNCSRRLGSLRLCSLNLGDYVLFGLGHGGLFGGSLLDCLRLFRSYLRLIDDLELGDGHRLFLNGSNRLRSSFRLCSLNLGNHVLLDLSRGFLHHFGLRLRHRLDVGTRGKHLMQNVNLLGLRCLNLIALARGSGREHLMQDRGCLRLGSLLLSLGRVDVLLLQRSKRQRGLRLKPVVLVLFVAVAGRPERHGLRLRLSHRLGLSPLKRRPLRVHLREFGLKLKQSLRLSGIRRRLLCRSFLCDGLFSGRLFNRLQYWRLIINNRLGCRFGLGLKLRFRLGRSLRLDIRLRLRLSLARHLRRGLFLHRLKNRRVVSRDGLRLNPLEHCGLKCRRILGFSLLLGCSDIHNLYRHARRKGLVSRIACISLGVLQDLKLGLGENLKLSLGNTHFLVCNARRDSRPEPALLDGLLNVFRLCVLIIELGAALQRRLNVKRFVIIYICCKRIRGLLGVLRLRRSLFSRCRCGLLDNLSLSFLNDNL